MDTRNKRASAITPLLPWRGQFPAPDSALDAGDRAQTGLLYRGLLDGGGSGPLPVGIVRATATAKRPGGLASAKRPGGSATAKRPGGKAENG